MIMAVSKCLTVTQSTSVYWKGILKWPVILGWHYFGDTFLMFNVYIFNADGGGGGVKIRNICFTAKKFKRQQ